ncbi:hypothetical protein ACGF7U_31370 [Micromonospora sp. NPDC047670]|uniref:hypothetical protein n=1 Tax=Micromonospora sp. NPDC047670 TaxID=3364252 RepID=UPI003714D1CB
MSLSREQAAQALGMKVREILAVDRVDGRYAVTTHDGQRTLVDDRGRLVDDRADAPAPPTPPATPAGPGTPAEQTSRPGPDGDQVPDGSLDVVLQWVGGDPQRAQAALDAENDREKPRSTLVEALERLTKA